MRGKELEWTCYFLKTMRNFALRLRETERDFDGWMWHSPKSLVDTNWLTTRKSHTIFLFCRVAIFAKSIFDSQYSTNRLQQKIAPFKRLPIANTCWKVRMRSMENDSTQPFMNCVLLSENAIFVGAKQKYFNNVTLNRGSSWAHYKNKLLSGVRFKRHLPCIVEMVSCLSSDV